jgi:transposase InsO family protein
MRKKASVPNRRYTEEFKSEAVRLALSTGGNTAAKRLGIPQSTMMNCVRANARLDAQVAAMHAASKSSYGRPRIVRALREQGLRVGHDRVRRSLQRQALRPVYKRPYRVTTDSNHVHSVAPNVLERRFEGWDINRAWVSDITYLSTIEGWLYLAVVMDLLAGVSSVGR